MSPLRIMLPHESFEMYAFANCNIKGNGYIEGTELDGFLREFVSSANITDVSPEVSTLNRNVYSVCKRMQFVNKLI